MTAEHTTARESELGRLLETIYQRYGFDFRDYARASLRRRVQNAVDDLGLADIPALQARVELDRGAMEQLLIALTVNVTSMYRDPDVFLTFRREVVPLLRSYPFTRIWHAGCSTGEEVYSMAILLHEEGLYPKCRIYATDMNEVVLQRAIEAVYPLESMASYADAYRLAGGTADFTDYYTARYGHSIVNHWLRRNIVFGHHNLVTDRSFNEFHVIFCRNVMIYFNRQLQDRVHRLLYSSLRRFGVLALGLKESLVATPHEHDYESIVPKMKLFRRRG
jgi:chemotaxis protein methyltransferase CheR